MRDTRGSVAGVVLGAGTSSRMGSNKLLIELGGETVIGRAARQACEAGLDPVIVVLGFEADRIARALQGLDVRTIVNERFDAGINTSAHLGIMHVPDECGAAVITLADMPLVNAHMIATVADRYRVGDPALVVSLYGDVHAPPTLYDRSLFPEFDGPTGEGCGRRIVRAHWEEAAKLHWPEELLADLDNPADVDRVRSRLIEAHAS